MLSSAGNACSVILAGMCHVIAVLWGAGCDLRLHPEAFDSVVTAVQLH